MSDPVIKVENLSKRYLLGHEFQKGEGLRHVIERAVRAPFTWLRSGGRAHRVTREEFWALRDINFEVQQGEVVGLIGRNGAGKSTLLKVLSRITEPTTGRIHLRGRVSSLLEVGTGFHPELTGRENIFLNGAVLGMARTEIKSKFDEIVAFAEIEKFLDTPVKRYSSGMYVRLAFAVAAHLEPEILIVDEVLAVGDANFQKKCLGKMSSVSTEGRTILFVSHNMAAVSRLCTRAVLLQDGRTVMNGPVPTVVEAYLAASNITRRTWENPKEKSDDSPGRIVSVRVLSLDGDEAGALVFHEGVKIEVCYEIFRPIEDLFAMFRIADSSGNVIFPSWDTDKAAEQGRVRHPGQYVAECIVPAGLLKPGHYLVGAGLIIPQLFYDWHEEIAGFEISAQGYPLNLDRVGAITPILDWKTRTAGQAATVAAK